MGISEDAHRVDAVLFDLDDTIYDQAQPFYGAASEVLGDLPAGVTADALYRASRRHSDEVYQAYNEGGRPDDAIYIRRMQRTMAEFGIDITSEQALAIQRAYSSHTGRYMRLTREMADCLALAAHRARCGIGIVTNGTHRKQLDKYEILGLERWIDRRHLFVSEDMKVAKPDPRIVTAACGAMGATPARSLFVGDSYGNDIRCAKEAGLLTVWIDRRGASSGSDASAFLLADHTVHDDAGLLEEFRVLL